MTQTNSGGRSSGRLVICNGWQRQLNGNGKMIWYMCGKMEKLLNSRKRRVSCNYIFHTTLQRDIFFFQKNHALLILHPISFMLRQTFGYYFDVNHVYISQVSESVAWTLYTSNCNFIRIFVQYVSKSYIIGCKTLLYSGKDFITI